MLEKSIGWQKSFGFALEVYKTTKKFPKEERFGLTSQINRSATSIPFNIAEGIMRYSRRELAQHLIIARDSCGEVATQLMLANKFGYINNQLLEKSLNELQEIIKILYSSIKTIKSS